MLKGLEQLGARLTCERAPDATLAGIDALHGRMMALYETRDRLEHFKLNQAIHTAFVAGSGNAVLVEVHATLPSRIKRLRDADGLAAVIGERMAATYARAPGARALTACRRIME